MTWEPLQLGDLVDFSNGLNFSEKNDGAGLKIVRVKDFGDNHFVSWTDLSEINPEGLKISAKNFLEPEDIVIVRSNGNKDLVGRSMIYAGPPGTTAFAGFCIRARVDRAQASPQYVHYWLRSPSTREKLSREGGGTGIQNVSQGLLKMQEINLPPLEEQQEIAAILGALDDKIELNRKTAATLEEMARSLYRSWFVDFDPVWAKLEGRAPAHMDATTAALFPDRFDDEGLPEGWKASPLLDVVELLSGGTPKTSVSEFWDGQIKWASAKDVSQCGQTFLLDTERKITKAGLDRSSTKIVPRFSTVVVARGATTGRACMFGEDIAMNQTCYALKSRDDLPFFANCLFMTEVLGITLAAHGSVFDTITTKTLQASTVVTPPVELARSFEAIVSPMFMKNLELSKENQTLANLRDTLLPRLMSGELRVGDAQEQVEDVA